MIIEAPPAWFAFQPACDDGGMSISPGRELDPIAIDPRPCGLCGLKIDRHERDDTPEGPIFLCADIDPDELTLPELERRAVLIEREEVRAMAEQWERADPRDRWRHTGEAAPPDIIRNGPQAEPCRPSRRPVQSTIGAFLYLVSLKDPDRLVAWLRERERDRPFLLTLLEAK
jgi:hypothetical protein